MFCVNVRELMVSRPLRSRRARGNPSDCARSPWGARHQELTGCVGRAREHLGLWENLCRGHLEFHFLADTTVDDLRRLSAAAPLRSPRFRFEPDCLGGLTFPRDRGSSARLRARRRSWPRRSKNLDPRWSAPPPAVNRSPGSARASGIRPTSRCRYGGRQRSLRRADLALWCVARCGLSSRLAAYGEHLISEDIALVMTVPMQD